MYNKQLCQPYLSITLYFFSYQGKTDTRFHTAGENTREGHGQTDN